MPTWVWVLLGLIALAVVLWSLERELGPDEVEKYGRAVAIFFILAVIAGLLIGFANMDWR